MFGVTMGTDVAVGRTSVGTEAASPALAKTADITAMALGDSQSCSSWLSLKNCSFEFNKNPLSICKVGEIVASNSRSGCVPESE